MKNWQVTFSDVICNQGESEALDKHIDDILLWFSKSYLSPDDKLSKHLLSKYSSKVLESRIFDFLDKLLFIDSQAGFCCVPQNLRAIKTRYHRLLQVYHPDKAKYKSNFLHDRTERINVAYARQRQLNNTVSVTKKEITLDFNCNATEDLSEIEISSAKLRFWVISLLLLISGLLLTYLYFEYNANTRSITLPDGVVRFEEAENQASLSHSLGLVENKKIPVELSEEEKFSLQNFVESWADSWESRNMSRYLVHYSDQFIPDNLSYHQWVEFRHHALSSKNFIKIRISDLEFSSNKNEVIAQFTQQYFSDTIVDEVQKRLLLRSKKSSPYWEILLEKTWQ